METLNDVMQQWETNPDFRQAFSQNPEEALKTAGITLAPEDFKKIVAMIELRQKKTTNTDLEDKINK